MKINTISS